MIQLPQILMGMHFRVQTSTWKAEGWLGFDIPKRRQAEKTLRLPIHQRGRGREREKPQDRACLSVKASDGN